MSEPIGHVMHEWQLDAFENQTHPKCLGGFRIVREPDGVYYGKVIPNQSDGITYVMGWLYGRDSVNRSTGE